MNARIPRLILLLFAATVFLTMSALAAEPGQSDEDEATEGTADSDSGAESYKVPEGSAEDLLKFIDELRGMRPRGDGREKMIESLKQANRAILAAADKILTNKPDDDTRTAAIGAKLDAISKLSQLGQEGAEDQLKKLADELKQGPDKDLAQRAQSILLQLRARKLMMGDVKGADQLLAEVTEQLAASPNDMSTVRVALGVAQALEYSGKTDKLAIQAYHDIAKILAKSTNEDVVRHAKQLEGVVRRLELVGKPIEITGTLLDGNPFDQATLKGKVVLVDFWATWCGPCLAELPNVLENYKKYHEKRFEVIGISLDEDRDALEKFVKDQEIPWPILFEDEGESKGWGNPMAAKYGIMGIPTVILVGPEGTVVSLNARGEKLGELLEKLLGPADEASDEKAGQSGDEKK